MKKLLLFPCLLLALGLSSCESSDDEIMSIELVSPKKLAVTTELATASFKWDAVAKAEGYAYALDNSTEYTTIDAATTTLKLTRLSRGSHTFRIYAVGNQEHTTDSAERTVDFDIDPDASDPGPVMHQRRIRRRGRRHMASRQRRHRLCLQIQRRDAMDRSRSPTY